MNDRQIAKSCPLLLFDRMNSDFQPVPLLGHDGFVLNVLLAQAGFERISCRLVDPRTGFRTCPVGALQRLLDGRFQSAHGNPLPPWAWASVTPDNAGAKTQESTFTFR